MEQSNRDRLITDAGQLITVRSEMSLHTLDVGPIDGEPLLFLHGFPDFSYGWREQLRYFSSRGYRCIAPDLHGYNLSSKPKKLKHYALTAVAADVIKLLDQLGVKVCNVVGHDWGAALTWTLVTVYPDRFCTGTVICVPHMRVFFDHLWKNRHMQLVRSSYMGFFQLPVVPELLFRYRGGRWLAELLAKSARRGAFSEADKKAYISAWSRSGAPTAMLNWYRANMRYRDSGQVDKVTIPMLIVWGDRDGALNRHMADDSLAHCDNGKVLHVEKGTHWVHVEFAEQVNEAIAGHIAALRDG